MAPSDRAADEGIFDDLSESDRAWLEEQLEPYRELLDYLRDLRSVPLWHSPSRAVRAEDEWFSLAARHAKVRREGYAK